MNLLQTVYLAAEDRPGLAIGRNPEQIQDPKRTLLTLARAAPRKIRDGLLPERGSSALVGPEYNDLLAEYVHNDWDIEAACHRATSLRRAVSADIKALAARFCYYDGLLRRSTGDDASLRDASCR
jgi:hypothetical protein